MNEINDEEFFGRPIQEVADDYVYTKEGLVPLRANPTTPVSLGGIKPGEVFVITAGGKMPVGSLLQNAYIENALKGNAFNSMWKSKDPNAVFDPEVVYSAMSKDISKMVHKDLSEKVVIMSRQTGKTRLTQSLIDEILDVSGEVRHFDPAYRSPDEVILIALDLNRRLNSPFKATVEKSRKNGYMKFALKQALSLSAIVQATDLKTIYSEPVKYVPKKSKRNKFDQLAQIYEAQAKKRRNGKR